MTVRDLWSILASDFERIYPKESKMEDEDTCPCCDSQTVLCPERGLQWCEECGWTEWDGEEEDDGCFLC